MRLQDIADAKEEEKEMILKQDLSQIGKVNKTHGVKGELSVSFLSPTNAEAIQPGFCLIMDVDGIYTPFFVASVRPRSAEALLITIDGIDTQEQAMPYVGLAVYATTDSLPQQVDDENDEDGMYASDLIGYKAINEDGSLIGEIIDVDDSTENVLFVIDRNGNNAYIPVVDEFIVEISENNHAITFTLPTGLID